MNATVRPPVPWSSLRGFGGRLRGSAVLLVLVAVVQVLVAASAAAGPPAPAASVARTTDGQLRVTLQVPDGGRRPVAPGSFSAVADGRPLPVRAQPVLTGELAMGLVIDGSEMGHPALSSGLSAAADFVLTASPSIRIALVVDTTPPALVVPLRPGRAEAVRGLAMVQPGGGRQTGAALEMALRQLPADTAQPRLLVLYTGAADAGGEPAAELAERLSAAGVVLAVISPTDDGQPVPPYWSTAATATGGVTASAQPSRVVAAFEQVAAAAASRYVLTFPVPAQLPTHVTVRVNSGDEMLTTDVLVPDDAAPTGLAMAIQHNGAGELHVLAFALAAAVLMATGTIVAARRRAATSVGSACRPVTVAAPWRTPPRIGSPRCHRGAVARSPTVGAAGRAWNIPARSVLLPGHKGLVAAVGRTLQTGEPALLSAAGGRAGTGAATAVIEFSHRHRDEYDIAWWIPAADPELVPDRLAELAEVLGVANRTDEAEVATHRLLQALRQRDRFLLVFAEAENPHQLARFLPQGAGHVVIISRDGQWRAHAALHTVDPFTRAESVALLCARRPDLTVNEAAQIAATLGDLPLAVDPAAALLTHTGMGADHLVRLLTDQPAEPRTDGERDDHAEAVWALLFDQLEADDPSAFALLTMTAWMGAEPVPLQLFADHPRHLPDPLRQVARNPDTLHRAVVTLHRRGLARVASGAIQLHRVPAALLVDRTAHRSPGDDEHHWAAITVRLLRAAVPREPASDPGVRRAWRRLLPLVLTATDPARPLDAVAADVGWLLGNTAGYLHTRGLRHSAEALFRDAHELGHATAPTAVTPARLRRPALATSQSSPDSAGTCGASGPARQRRPGRR